MNFFSVFWESLSIEARPIDQLIDISSQIDAEKRQPGLFINSYRDEDMIASIIVALLNEPSTHSVGKKLYDAISNLIVEKNALLMDGKNGKETIAQLHSEGESGLFKIRQTRSGCKFDLVASNGEILGTSEVYSSLTTCANAIKSVQRFSDVPIEKQTENNYTTLRNPKYEVYQDKAGEYRFRLKLSNGQIILVSGGHPSLEKCLTTISRIKLAVVSADVEKG